jgi:uncharacterized cupin superfamily protein
VRHPAGGEAGSICAMRSHETFAVQIADLALEPDPVDPASVVSGDPQVSNRVVWESEDGRVIRGVWQITPGTVTDTEAHEMFVVVSGRATIAVEGGATFEVGPGDMGVLEEGARTSWTVHETLRKAYQITLPAG